MKFLDSVNPVTLGSVRRVKTGSQRDDRVHSDGVHNVGHQPGCLGILEEKTHLAVVLLLVSQTRNRAADHMSQYDCSAPGYDQDLVADVLPILMRRNMTHLVCDPKDIAQRVLWWRKL